jgi:membrane associated rhomboid family serine protease
LRRRFSAGGSRTRTPARNVLVILNIIVFSYQVTNSVNFVRRKHPAYWPNEALLIIWDGLIGASIMGPFTMDFVHSEFLSRRQPYRYLTAGFLHGSLIHLLVNMDSLLRTAAWLETGLGWSLFVTTFLVGIISGNVWHVLSSLDNSSCLGASGGICGLYGLMFVSLIKMGNTQLGWRVLKSMGVLLLYGLVFTNVSNAAHIGGFLGGIAMGLLCCPSYRKSYTMTRKNSLQVDLADREYRLAMGFGKVPSKRGLIPVSLIWIAALFALASNPLYRRIPMQVYHGIVRPGSLSNMRPL